MSGIRLASCIGSMWCRPNSWKPGESISAVRARRVDPVPGGAGGGVLARIQRLRNLAGRAPAAPGTSRLISVLLPAPEGPSTSVVLPAQVLQQRARGRRRRRRAATAAARRSPCAGRAQPRPGPLEGLDQVALVQRDQRRRCRSASAAISARASWFSENSGSARDQDQHLVEVGGERLGADLVLPVEQVAPRRDLLDRAFVLAGLPAHPVADHRLALLAARVADEPLAVGRLDHAVPAVAGDHQAVAQRPRRACARPRSQRGVQLFMRATRRRAARSRSRWPKCRRRRAC